MESDDSDSDNSGVVIGSTGMVGTSAGKLPVVRVGVIVTSGCDVSVGVTVVCLDSADSPGSERSTIIMSRVSGGEAVGMPRKKSKLSRIVARIRACASNTRAARQP